MFPITSALLLENPSLDLLSVTLILSHSMGLSVSSLFGSLSSLLHWSKDQDVRILMLGLDSAGKVSLPVVRSLWGNSLTVHTDDDLIQATGMTSGIVAL